jgi:1,4-dihydroxy-6-naphthoate synthase
MMTFGFSPCPNDTYIFYALANNKIDLRGLEFDFVIKDVELLNQLAISKKLEISKVSSHAYFHLRRDYVFLNSGAAFGRGCGPLMVANEDFSIKEPGRFRIGVPGKLTTAFLLLKLYISAGFEPQFSNLDYIFMPFNEIMGAVKNGDIDAGLVIHEGRFTFADYGLVKIVDLGEWWETETGFPIPLGGIIAKKEIASDTIKIIEDLIIKSVEYSGNNFDKALGFIKQHSQELDDRVIMQHISLYVNDYTMGIGDEGEKALNELFARAERFNV